MSRLYGDYPTLGELEDRYRGLAARLGGRESVAGQSVEGRPLWYFDIGDAFSQTIPDNC